MSGIDRVWYAEAPPLPTRALLSGLSLGYRGAVAAKNLLFDLGLRQPARIEGVRIVSVGNLNVGGAGKTPAVIHLVGRAQARGLSVAVLSRGYGRSSREEIGFDASWDRGFSEVGDEPLLIARRCPGVKVWVGADRVSTARKARDSGAKLLILDDGFQHRRLARDVDVVVVNGARGFGNGRLLPRGPLREPLSALRRAGLVWLREGQPEVSLPSFEVPVVRARHAVSGWTDVSGAHQPSRSLEGRRVIAVSALADPNALPTTLRRLGAELVESHAYPDHHVFAPEEIGKLQARAAAVGAELFTTEKDAVRLPPGFAAVVRLDVEILEGAFHLDRLLAPDGQTG